ncbi:MAG: hypothetical protein Q8N56_00455 [bacterium]|nr:hypothetical protein [bacterium]
MKTLRIKRFLYSLGEPAKPWWLAVVAYLVFGLVLVTLGATVWKSEIVTQIVTICFGILLIAIGIMLAIGGRYFIKKK